MKRSGKNLTTTALVRNSNGPKPVLIVQHAHHEHPAAIRRALDTQGITTLWIHPYRGEAYPSVTEISGIISLGGPMGANDDALHPWIPAECELLRRCVDLKLPTVGICLGGQLLARAMGGRVERNPKAEIGWFPIILSAVGRNDPIVAAAGPSPTVYQWHEDTFYLPSGAVHLAGSMSCPRQAFRIGENAYGFQFHPEADHQLVGEWLSIEETGQEITEALQKHGPDNVQDAAMHRAHSTVGEKSSLKITAAISSLFRIYSGKKGLEKDNAKDLENWAKLLPYFKDQVSLAVEFKNAAGTLIQLQGVIQSLLVIPYGEFVIFKANDSLLWPMQIDAIEKIFPL